MTLLGKIFTMLIFIMSIGFMFVSVMVFATHKNWKLVAINPRKGEALWDERFEKLGLRYQIEDARNSVAELKRERQIVIDQLERERASRRMAIQHLQTSQNTVTSELNDLRGQLNAATTENAKLLEDLDIKEDRLAALTTEVGGLRTDIQAAQQARDEEFLKVVQITDQLHQYEGMKRRLEERRDQLAMEITARKRVMDKFGLTQWTPLSDVPPVLYGYVTKVSDRSKNLIEISLGEDDGIRINHELVVFRDKSYLGRIKIREVSSNVAVGEVLIDTRKGTIRKGDNVTTRFS